MKDQRITNEEKSNAQVKQSRAAYNPLEAETEQSKAEAKVAFYKSVQALRREMKMQSK